MRIEQSIDRAPATALDARLAVLRATQPEGHALLQSYYRDPAIYERDIERILLRRWLLACHASDLPDVGDYRVIEIAGESVILVRGKDSKIRGLMNVCRHRGSHVCYEKSGNAKLFVCPYHAWSYDLDGTLKAARHVAKEIDKAAFGLKSIHAAIVEGLIFICFAEQPPALDNMMRTVRASLGRHGWADARIAHRETFTMAANWKLAVENYLECYHCLPAHPEYAKLHSNDELREKVVDMTAALAERARVHGIDIADAETWMRDPASPREDVFCLRVALYGDTVTGSQDGRALAPLMGDFSTYDGGATFVHVGPASFFLAYADHGIAYRFVPREPEVTDLEVLWLVRADAVAERDYDLDRLTWLWQVTSEEDKLIVEKAQLGVNSRYYEPGPYAPHEPRARQFAAWYLAKIA
jgi:phenylpropionate dioxygenase-like ring-hydroxylating dioxygenase large terminal subunit